MSNDLFFPQLAPDDGRWRIDWFGEVAYPGVVKQYRQPCIKVSISPVQEVADIHRQRTIWMPFASLAVLRIGDIWQHGRLLDSPWHTQKLVDLKITPHTTRFVKAGLAIDDSYLLPFAEHPWHRLHTQSYCLAVDTPDDVTLLIPAVELIRFYFGSSSNLLRRLVEHPLKEEALWKSKNFNPETQHLHLKLADGLSGMSAADIGRIAMDSTAWSAASGVFASCIKATSQGMPAYPCMGFPFQGETSMVVRGMYLSFGGEKKSNFLVFHLKHCSHPFPFKSLTYETGNLISHKRSTGANDGSATAERGWTKRKSESVLEYGDPGARKKARRFNFDQAWRFADLQGKSIWQERVVAAGSCDILRKRDDGVLERVSIGEAMGSNMTSAIDVQITDEPRQSPIHDVGSLPYFVRNGIRQISAKHRKTGPISFLLPTGEARTIFPLPIVVDECGEIDVGASFVTPDGSLRPRQACFVQFQAPENDPSIYGILEGGKIRDSPVVCPVQSVDILQLLQMNWK